MSWCFEDESAAAANEILALLKDGKAIVPHIWRLEISNVLAVAERNKRIKHSDSEIFIDLLNKLAIEIDDGLSGLLNMQILTICRKHNLSAYDAAYLELAKRYDVPLATFDKTLSRSAKKEGVVLAVV
jgi:predicted nucleic acid-binding protein